MDNDDEIKDLMTLDTLFKNFDEYGEFNLYYRISKDVVFKTQQGIAYNPVTRVSEMLKKYGYAIVSHNSMVECMVELTEIGREAQAAGGHFLYLKKRIEKEKIDDDRQKRKDSIDQFDFYIKNWTYKSRYLPYLISVCALTISIITYFKNGDKKGVVKRIETNKSDSLLKNVEKLKINLSN